MRSDNLAPISAENLAHLCALYGADRVVPCNADVILGAPNAPFAFEEMSIHQRLSLEAAAAGKDFRTHSRKVSQAFAKQNQEQERQ